MFRSNSSFAGMFMGAICGLVAVPAQAAQLDVLADAVWTFKGVHMAFPIDNPFDDVFLTFAGPTEVQVEAGNFATLLPEVTRTDILRVSNPSAERIAVDLAFDYQFFFAFGPFANATDPGDYDVSLSAMFHATPEGGAERLLGSLVFDDRLSCPTLPCDFEWDVVSKIGSDISFAYLDFEMDPLATTNIALRLSVDIDVLPVSAQVTGVPVPMSASLVLTGLGTLAIVRRRSAGVSRR